MAGSRIAGCMALLGLCWSAPLAHAQEAGAPAVTDAQLTMTRPVEVLFGIDDLTSWQGRGQDLRLSVSVPRSERMAIELFGGAYRGNERKIDVRSVAGFQFRQRLMRVQRQDQELFATYGMVFVISDTKCTPSCYGGIPSFAPLGTLGFGFQQSIASRLAVRAELQGGFFLFVPMGVRVAAGVAIPLGGMRVPRNTD